jgi:hypothetical protein
MAQAVASSGLFGIKTADQALALMLIAAAEGRHPALAARDYDIINGRPAKKTEAMLRDFLQQEGTVEWHKLDDAVADATFSHPSGGTVRISWDMARVRKAKIANPAMYEKYPRAMLRSRTVSEGVRTVCPMATSGMYVPEEIHGFGREKDITPSAGVADQLTRDETMRVQEVAANMHEWLAQGSVGDAVYEMENAALNAEQQIYAWTFFDSKRRSAMKKEQARMKAAAKLAAPQDISGSAGNSPSSTAPAGAASESKQERYEELISDAARKRLEARISELELERENVKAYMTMTFGHAHFSELTKDEYRVVDGFVELAGSDTLEELAASWNALGKEDKKLLTAIKDMRKTSLEAAQSPV